MRYISLSSSFALLTSIGIIIFIFFRPDIIGEQNKAIDWSRIILVNGRGVFTTMGYYFLSFCYQAMVVEIANGARPISKLSSAAVIFLNTIFSIACYLLVSFFGYFIIYERDDIQKMDNFLTFLSIHLLKKQWFIILSNMLVLISVTFANTMNFFPVISYVKDTIESWHPFTRNTDISNRSYLQEVLNEESTYR